MIVLSGATSYVQFNLAGIPTNAPISKATLRVFVDAVADAGSFDVYQVNSAWAENTLTYNNAPALGTSATGGNPVSDHIREPAQIRFGGHHFAGAELDQRQRSELRRGIAIRRQNWQFFI